MNSIYSSGADGAFESGKSGSINPVLVQLYQTHGIRADAMNNLPSGDRAGLCDDIARLIETAGRQTDRELATDILISLLRQAEKNLKQALAERLSIVDDAPLRLVLQFINDDIDVARPILATSKALNDLDLLYIIQSRDSPFWQAIATRQDLGENVVETLVDTKDVLTAKELVLNKTVSLTEYAASKIARLADDSDILSEALILRGREESGELARKIYAYASQSLKDLITENCGRLSSEVSRKLDEVLVEFNEPTPHHFMPSASMIKAAELFAEQGKLNKTLMLNTLKRGQISSFIAQFAQFINLPIAVVVPMLQQKNGQGLAIAAKAYDIDKTDFLMIFNFTRKMMGEDYLSSNDAGVALAHYNRVSPDVAKRLMRKTKH